MAVKTLYLKNAVPAGATLHRSLQDGGSAPATATTATGWVAGTNASGRMCIQTGGTEYATGGANWGVTAQPASSPSQTIGDCWRTENALNGTFANANWTFTLGARSITAAYTGRCRLRVRVWKSTNANGTGAVELTGATQTSSTSAANMSTSADTTFSLTWSPGSAFTFIGEYLFVQMAFEVTSAGSGATQDFDFRVGAAYTVATADFTQLSMPAATGAFALAGIDAAMRAATNVGRVLWAEVAVPHVGAPYTMPATVGAFALTGIAAIPQFGRHIQPAVGAFVETVYAAGFNWSSTRVGRVMWAQAAFPRAPAALVLAADIASFALTGYIADLIRTPGPTRAGRAMWAEVAFPQGHTHTDYMHNVYVGTFDVTGNWVNLSALMSVDVFWLDIVGEDGYSIEWGIASGVYTNSGNAAADATSYTITGLANRTTYFWHVAGTSGGVPGPWSPEGVFTTGIGPAIADPVAFTVAGNAVGMVRGRIAAAATGAFTLSGFNAGLVPTGVHLINATTGAFAVTGNAANLISSVIGAYQMIADPAAFVETGNAVGFNINRTMAANAAVFTLTGNAAGSVQTYAIAANTAAFDFTGVDANLRTPGLWLMTASPAAFDLAATATTLGQGHVAQTAVGAFDILAADANFLLGRGMPANTGFFDLTGFGTTLLKQGNIVLSANVGAFIVDGYAATLRNEVGLFMAAALQRYYIAGPAARLGYSKHQHRPRLGDTRLEP